MLSITMDKLANLIHLLKPSAPNTTVKTKLTMDLERCKEAEEHLDVIMKQISKKTGKEYDATLTRTRRLLKRWMGRSKKDAIERTVEHTVRKGYGRFYSEMSFLNFKRELRQFLARDMYVDLDIVNCHPVIAQQLYQILTGKTPEAVSTINKCRNAMFASFMKHHGLSKDQCKKFVYAILYEGDVESVLESYGLSLPELEQDECLKAFRTFQGA